MLLEESGKGFLMELSNQAMKYFCDYEIPDREKVIYKDRNLVLSNNTKKRLMSPFTLSMCSAKFSGNLHE